MLNAKHLYSVLLIILVMLSGCKTFPIVEICIHGENALICVDKRLPPEKQNYSRPWNNDICTNPDDFNSMEIWVRQHDQ